MAGDGRTAHSDICSGIEVVTALNLEANVLLPIVHGNSYIQTVGWDEAGNLDAHGILTYSQSPEPDSPHYADQTRLYSRGELIEFPFTEEEIQADPELRVVTLRE